MAEALKSMDAERTRIMLGLLESVERGGEQSQRRLASELGVALGLVNAYLKRCVKKGLVKVRQAQAPARRYAYYLTPNGFAEKSRLTIEYMSYSFMWFRRAKTDCVAALAAARERGFGRIALLGASDLAEIAAICVLDSGLVMVAVVDPTCEAARFAGAPVVRNLGAVDAIDAVLVTDIRDADAIRRSATDRLGSERVFIPALLVVRSEKQKGAA
jgi:DNA-binding MarR family transcriptional regulator